MSYPQAPALLADEPLIDPDCRDGKHSSCVGGPCECSCHSIVCTVCGAHGRHDCAGPRKVAAASDSPSAKRRYVPLYGPVD